MAIYVNDRVLKADPSGNKMEREYHSGLQKVTALFEKFRIKGDPEAYIHITHGDTTSVRSMDGKKEKRRPTVALPVTLPYYDDELGATVIRYATSPPEKTDSGKMSWTTKYIEFRGTLVIGDRQKDLAWFLLFASNMVEKGVYQMVDKKAKYEGSFNDIIVKKNVIDVITGVDEDLVRRIAIEFMSESVSRLEHKDMATKVYEWLEATGEWKAVYTFISTVLHDKILEKENISELTWEGQPVLLVECPASVKFVDLKAEAQALGIKVTVPPPKKEVLYSLVQHVKELEKVD